MARRDIPMNEIMETIYQWHEGRKIKQISVSLGIDRKTVRKYLGLLNDLSIRRGNPLPEEQDLIGSLKDLMALVGSQLSGARYRTCWSLPGRHKALVRRPSYDRQAGVAAFKRELPDKRRLYDRQAVSTKGVSPNLPARDRPHRDASRRRGPGRLRIRRPHVRPNDAEEAQGMGLHHDPLL